MCPKETAAAVTALAVMISDCLDEANALYFAALLTQLGDTVAALAAGKDLCE